MPSNTRRRFLAPQLATELPTDFIAPSAVPTGQHTVTAAQHEVVDDARVVAMQHTGDGVLVGVGP
jgi:hypothetical protein